MKKYVNRLTFVITNGDKLGIGLGRRTIAVGSDNHNLVCVSIDETRYVDPIVVALRLGLLPLGIACYKLGHL